jgi:hypothetical protein
MICGHSIGTCWTSYPGGIACASAIQCILCGRLRVTLVWAVNVYDDRRGIEACIVC